MPADRTLTLLATVVVILAAAATAAVATPPVRERVDLATDTELRMDGSTPGDALGSSVDGAGDVNGDGRADIIFGSENPGAAYVVFGGTRGVVEAGSLGSRGFKIEISDRYARTYVSGAGDVNGDGLADVIVGDRDGGQDDDYSGSAYVVFGKATTTTVDAGALGNRGFRITGAARRAQLGWRVDAAGDVNRDGLADVLVSAPWAESAYVVFGKESSEPVDIAALGTGGYRIYGGNLAGLGLAGAGDFNGDGRPDVLIGQASYSYNAPIFVVYGKDSPDTVHLGLLGSSGVEIRRPVGTNSTNSELLSGAGDVNGDGFDDVVIGGDPSHVVFGRRSTAPIELAALGDGGFRISGAVDGSGAYARVAGAGDIDRDGLADVMVSTPYANATGGAGAGRTYLVLGRASTEPVLLDSLAGRGFEIHGASTYDYSGSAIAGAGDVDADGHPDLLIGAQAADSNARGESGSAYLVRGGRCCRRALEPPGSPTRSIPLRPEALMRVAGEGVGEAVDSAGDVNGDGLDDFLATARGSRPVGHDPESVYVLFGTRKSANIVLPALGSHGFRIDVAADEWVASASGAGDVNRDGLADVIVGVSKDWRYPGPETAYVVFGKRTAEPVVLATLGARGFRIAGPDTGASREVSVAGLGDVNGDGRSDVAVGMPDATEDERLAAAFVVFGKSSAAQVDLAQLGAGGYRIAAGGALYDAHAPAVRAPGDVNGDGRADVTVTVRDGTDPFYSGVTYVLFGKGSTDPVDVHALHGAGFRIEGPPRFDDADLAVDGAGDVNGDRHADIVLTYPYAANYLRDLSGWSYVVFGKGTGDPVRLAQLGSGGIRISGNPLTLIPFAASGAGDFNHDGRSDVVLAAYGTACVVLGQRKSATLDVGGLGRRGLCFDRFEGSSARRSVAGGGDVNGDRYADLIVGAQYEGGYEGPYPFAGAVYVVPGRKVR